jgi:hypothetical protein
LTFCGFRHGSVFPGFEAHGFSGTGTADFNVQPRVRHPTLYFSLDKIIVDYATGAIALLDVFYPPIGLKVSRLLDFSDVSMESWLKTNELLTNSDLD